MPRHADRPAAAPPETNKNEIRRAEERPKPLLLLGVLQIDGRGLALLAALEVVAELLALVQAAMPARSTAEMCTNTSFEPSSG